MYKSYLSSERNIVQSSTVVVFFVDMEALLLLLVNNFVSQWL